MFTLFPHQSKFKDGIYNQWGAGHKNVLGIKPTGAGKTVVLSDIVHDHEGASCTIAHRRELVSQISMALARQDTPHRIIGPQPVIKDIVRSHTRECGFSYHDPRGSAAVAGVDTLIRRPTDWCNSVGLWVIDEAHHVLTSNKWGAATRMFPNARGLGVTATPCRADGAGLGAHADGVFHAMVEGPNMAWLIENNYLTKYKVYCPPVSIEASNDWIGQTGEFSQPKLKLAAKKSHIVGDVVQHYRRYVNGMCGVVFATDVETAEEMADRFKSQGITAAAVSAETGDSERGRLIDDFRNGKIKVLCNVDLFGEGFDLPAIQFVIMGRPTMSYALYAQQFGRALRIMAGKEYAIIIDCVGNVERHHGPPDRPKKWTLDQIEKAAKMPRDPELIPTRTCTECVALYEAVLTACPWCGAQFIPAGRSRPEQVDGDLIELDQETLNQLFGEIQRIDADPEQLRKRMQHGGAPVMAVMGAVKQHKLRQEMQGNLRDVMALWGGYQKNLGRDRSESQKRFFWRFGVDVASAQALSRKDAEKLAAEIGNDLLRF